MGEFTNPQFSVLCPLVVQAEGLTTARALDSTRQSRTKSWHLQDDDVYVNFGGYCERVETIHIDD
jgi:hypothetical protein